MRARRSRGNLENPVKNPPPATSLTIPNPQDFWYNRKTMLDSAAPRQKNDRPVIPRPRFRFRVGLGIFMLLLLAAGAFIGRRLAIFAQPMIESVGGNFFFKP